MLLAPVRTTMLLDGERTAVLLLELPQSDGRGSFLDVIVDPALGDRISPSSTNSHHDTTRENW